MNLTPEELAALDNLNSPPPLTNADHQRFYVETIVAEYRVMSRVQRWLFRQAAPFTEIAARHLEELNKETR